MLHDCQGIQTYQDRWAETFNQWGFLTLQVDSFSARNVSGTSEDVLEEGLSGLGGERLMDAFGALFYLEQHPKVDRERVGAVGWSRSSTTGSALKDGWCQFFDHGIKAIVSFYPNCKSVASAEFADPILIVVAGEDDWTIPRLCSDLAAADPNVDAILMENALHGFDDPKWGRLTEKPNYQNTLKQPTFGVTFGYDAGATERTAEAIKAYFLQRFWRLPSSNSYRIALHISHPN